MGIEAKIRIGIKKAINKEVGIPLFLIKTTEISLISLSLLIKEKLQ